jgi:hypothetical protein
VSKGEVFRHRDGCFAYSPGYDCPEFLPGHEFSSKPGQLLAAFEIDYYSLALVLIQLFNADIYPIYYRKSPSDVVDIMKDNKQIENICSKVKNCSYCSDALVQLWHLNPSVRRTGLSDLINQFQRKTSLVRENVKLKEENSFLKGAGNMRESVVAALLCDQKNELVAAIEKATGGFARKLQQLAASNSPDGGKEAIDGLAAMNEELDKATAPGQESSANAAILKEIKSMREDIYAKMEDIRKNTGNQQETALLIQQLAEGVSGLQSSMQELREEVSAITEQMAGFGDGIRKVVDGNTKLRSLVEQLAVDTAQYSSETAAAVTDLRARMTTFGSSIAALESAGQPVLAAQMQEQLSAQSLMLRTLIQNNHRVPTLAVILPHVSRGLKGRFNPKKLTHEIYDLHFICSHTLQIVPCGPEGRGYKFTVLREWVAKAAPVLKACLIILKIAMTAAGLPLPIPGLTELLTSDALGASVDYVDSALTIFNDNVVEAPSADAESIEGCLKKLQTDSEGSRAAYESIFSLLNGKECNDPTLKYCGLTLEIASRSGISSWVKDDPAVRASFHQMQGQRRYI